MRWELCCVAGNHFRADIFSRAPTATCSSSPESALEFESAGSPGCISSAPAPESASLWPVPLSRHGVTWPGGSNAEQISPPGNRSRTLFHTGRSSVWMLGWRVTGRAMTVSCGELASDWVSEQEVESSLKEVPLSPSCSLLWLLQQQSQWEDDHPDGPP